VLLPRYDIKASPRLAILQPLDPNSAIVVDAAYGVNLG